MTGQLTMNDIVRPSSRLTPVTNYIYLEDEKVVEGRIS
jgi:hypothetical protein